MSILFCMTIVNDKLVASLYEDAPRTIKHGVIDNSKKCHLVSLFNVLIPNFSLKRLLP